MKNFIRKTKVWIKENEDLAKAGAYFGGAVAVFVGICVVAAKAGSKTVDDGREAERAIMYQLGKADAYDSFFERAMDGRNHNIKINGGS